MKILYQYILYTIFFKYFKSKNEIGQKGTGALGDGLKNLIQLRYLSLNLK